jgi:peptidoglycan/xylan/chitin deacetylase (PgdA/CDA1 family)
MNISFLLSFIVMYMTICSCQSVPNHNQSSHLAPENKIETKVSNTNNPAANTASQIYARPQIPILCYHRIALGMKSDYEVSPATFTAHMKILADSGYHSISPDQLYNYLVYNKPLPVKPVMITFDDSRIEHYQIAGPVLEKNGFRGVFFIMMITLNKKNYMSADQIAQLAKNGHTVGLHSYDHVMVTKYKNADDWKKELTDPKKKLEKIINQPVDYWAYPDGIYNHQSAEELSKYFKISFSLATPRDTQLPLQSVRRMIVTERSPENLLVSMRRTFGNHNPRNNSH